MLFSKPSPFSNPPNPTNNLYTVPCYAQEPTGIFDNTLTRRAMLIDMLVAAAIKPQLNAQISVTFWLLHCH